MAKFIDDEDIKKIEEISKKKSGYGIEQVKTEFSPLEKIMNDSRAVQGIRVKKDKLYRD